MHHAGWMALAAMSAALAMGDVRADDEPALTQLETVVVSGIQPGPGLWQVKRDGHRMWVLGTLTPLPKRMQWESLEVEERIAQSQEVIYPPTAELTVKGGIIGGLFGGSSDGKFKPAGWIMSIVGALILLWAYLNFFAK